MASVRIRQFAPDGAVIYDRSYRTVSRPLTRDDVNIMAESLAYLAAAPGVVFVARPSEVRDSMFIPKAWPPTTEIFAGNDGSLWLRQPEPLSDIAHFWRIDSSGKLLPAVAVASNLRILQVSENMLWAATEDKDGTPIVEVHRVVPR